MSNRLDQESEAKLQPKRIQVAINELAKIGIIPHEISDTYILFMWKGFTVQYYAYSGWATGVSIKDGRGLQNLLKQLTITPTKQNN